MFYNQQVYLATMDDCNNSKSCLLQQLFIHLKIDT